MNEEDCRFLTYKMGGAWHERKPCIYHPEGCLCGHNFFPACPSNRTFDNWEEFGELWNWATKQEWWDKFLFFSRINMDDILDSEGAEPVSHSCMGLVNPTRFPKLITDFMREREKGEGDGAKSR